MPSRIQNQPLHKDFSGIEKEFEVCLSNGFPMLFFPDNIEKQFLCDTQESRKRSFLVTGLIAVFLYNLFLLTDIQMVPDIWKLAWTIRICIITPSMLLLLMAIKKNWLNSKLEYIVDLLVMITTVSIIIIYDLSDHHNASYYHTGIILSVMFGNIVVRLRFWHAFIISWTTFILYIVIVNRIHNFEPANIMNSIIVCFTATAISQVANYQMELDERYNYLRSKIKEITNLRLSISRDELERISTIDELTGIANRRLFDSAFDKEWRVALRYQAPISLIFMDIDEFKAFNDFYGHQAGDECLKKVARLIKTNVHRPHDLCARYGGEEFVILLSDTCLDSAMVIAEKMRHSLDSAKIPHQNSKVADHVTACFGVACLIPSIEGFHSELLENADKALYMAKESGKNTVIPYTSKIGCK
ncbi:GGDEF domain-containing protein [Desulforegula conservatrix]|uniref:GGDEF domain-containing protein n=1 Tax=Desulforegula conservatrix TaxID=153026 RepID=UPI000687D69D|nr:GGDEF domain-containing protein [Desulforegula conservatrix]